MIPHLCLCSLCFLQSCNKSLINQACSGPYLETIGPMSFLYLVPIISQYGPRSWLVRCVYNTIQYNTIQYNAMQCNAMQCNAMQYNTIQCNTMQCNAMQYNAMQCNTIQCNAMYCMQCIVSEAYHPEASNFCLYVGNYAGVFYLTNQKQGIIFCPNMESVD